MQKSKFPKMRHYVGFLQIGSHFTHAAIIATNNSAIQLHIRRLKGLGILCRSQQSCRHMIHGRVRQVGGNELTS